MSVEEELMKRMLQAQLNIIIDFTRKSSDNLYKQLEALYSLNNFLRPEYPFPPMRGWPISPDFGLLIMEEIFSKKPDNITDLGSGVSTLISAYSCKKMGKGTVTSLEHEKEYYEKTRETLRKHKLEEYVNLVLAPLVKTELNEKEYHWYDIGSLKIDRKIDILIVDGPPGKTGIDTRFPAYDKLSKYFAKDISILIDDANRKEETDMVNTWCVKEKHFVREDGFCEKGCVILRRTP